MIQEIQHHIRVIHRLVERISRETVIIVPWLHHADHLIYLSGQHIHVFIIRQHITYLPLAKPDNPVKPGIGAHIGTDIESTCHVIHGDRRDSRDEHTLDRSISRGTLFQLIKEIAEEPRAMCQFTVMLIPHIGEYGVREIIILIDEQVDRKIQQRSLPDQVVQFLVCVLEPFQFTGETGIEHMSVKPGEKIETHRAIIIERGQQPIRVRIHAGEIKIEHKVFPLFRRRMRTDIQPLEDFLETIPPIDIIIPSKHVDKQRLSKTPRTDQEEEIGRFLQPLDIMSLIHIIIRLFPNPLKIRQSVRNLLYYHSDLCFYE